MDGLLWQLEFFLENFGTSLRFASVFIGGGTPGLLGKEYGPIFDCLAPYLADNAEITLEANPDDIQQNSLETWRSLGFNRLSVGIQTFSPRGLKELSRRHSSQKSREALELALGSFDNVNADLIYGWAGETPEDWDFDLAQVVGLEIPHLSLYNLTYEPGTVLTRRKNRGLLAEQEDAQLEVFYKMAQSRLQDRWQQDEVANWSQVGYSCRHNWIYWQDQPYLAFGCGAHGYLADGGWGLRYSFPKTLRTYLASIGTPDRGQPLSPRSFLESQGASLETDRGPNEWLLETVGCGLRSAKGVDIGRIETLLNCKFVPSKLLNLGLNKGLLTQKGSRITLATEEWFRECRWALELADSFPRPTEGN